MADLTLQKQLELLGLPTFVAANAGGDRAPNPNGRTQLWVVHDVTGALPTIDLSGQDISVENADGAECEWVDRTTSVFSSATVDMIIQATGFFNGGGNDGFFRVISAISGTRVKVKALVDTTTVNESSETDIILLSHITLRVTSQRESSFGPFDDAYIPIPNRSTNFTSAYDPRRFNDLTNFVVFTFDTEVANITIAAVEYGVLFKDR